MRRVSLIALVLVLTSVACGDTDGGGAAPTTTQAAATTAQASTTTTSEVSETPTTGATSTTGDTGAIVDDDCGHDVDPAVVELGFNEVVDVNGIVKAPTGAPLQEGDTLRSVAEEVTDHNSVAYAQIASLMMPIRDALMCDITTISNSDWQALTEVLDLNNIKTTQDLSGTPPEQFYSSDGIFDHLQDGADFHPMMKYLEEAELELKCLAFVDFDFTNPEGDNHCEIHDLDQGTGLALP